MKKILFIPALVIFISLIGCSIHHADNNLEADFINPPHSVKPRTWLHVMSGNMSREGLTKDLEAIQKNGISGVMLFNVATGIPYGSVAYNSDEHHELLKHAATECERLGLTFGVHNCAGWSSSGGPWNTPENSMKMLVWSEKVMDGGSNISVKLEQPTTREGFYRDELVLAYPALDSEIEDEQAKPVVISSDQNYNVASANNFKLDIAYPIGGNEDNPWILYEYQEPFTIRSAYVVCTDRQGEISLQVSNDGNNFTTIKDLSKGRSGKGEWVHTAQFEPLTARYFRLKLTHPMNLFEARLMATLLIDDVFGRTAMARTEDRNMPMIGSPEETMVIDKNAIIDLTSNMNADGVLNVKLPEGKWTVMRFGYTSTGAYNRPASDAGRGLECDKLNRAALKIHYDNFVARFIKESGPVAPNALQYIAIDSYEQGGQNWTDDMLPVFSERKGYDLKTFLPLFAGRFVGSAEETDAVSWDFRRLVNDLMTENYFGYFAELCHRDGLKSYIEPYGNGPFNSLDAGGTSDVNLGEFWIDRDLYQIRAAVSASHIFGKNIISAEAFTSVPGINWKGHPAMAKLQGDRAWALGINDFFFHRFTHQANTHVKPGMTMNRWGFHIDRTQTWWENAGAEWFKYIARGSHLLRQGYPVADMLIFVGDGAPNSVYERQETEPSIPTGINFDNANADVLKNRLEIGNGNLVLPEGITYQMLVLQNCETITLESLERIAEIAKAGVVIAGDKPEHPAGYFLTENDRDHFRKLVDDTWSLPNVYESSDWEAVMNAEGILPDLVIHGRDDIQFAHRKTPDADIYFLYNPDSVAQRFECTFRIRNKLPELWDAKTGNIRKSGQFANTNQTTTVWVELEAEESVFVIFRENSTNVVSVANPGENTDIKYFLDNDNQVVGESQQNGIFTPILTTGQKTETEISDIPEPLRLEGPWEVEFLKEHDYAGIHTFEQLTDWKDSGNENIKYYSGTAIYRKTFTWDESSADANSRYILELGDVKIVAEVRLNGKEIGVSWMAPFRLDITEALLPGENLLEIKITNQWSNRLIGDERFPKQDGGYSLSGNPPASDSKMPDWYINNEPMPEGPRTTFCTGQFYNANDPLMPSGLMGPVYIKTVKQIKF